MADQIFSDYEKKQKELQEERKEVISKLKEFTRPPLHELQEGEELESYILAKKPTEQVLLENRLEEINRDLKLIDPVMEIYKKEKEAGVY